MWSAHFPQHPQSGSIYTTTCSPAATLTEAASVTNTVNTACRNILPERIVFSPVRLGWNKLPSLSALRTPPGTFRATRVSAQLRSKHRRSQIGCARSSPEPPGLFLDFGNRHCARMRKILDEHFLHTLGEIFINHPCGELEIKPERTIIHIHGSNRRSDIIDQYSLAVQKAVLTKVALHAGLQERPDQCIGSKIGQHIVSPLRDEYAH